MFPIITLKGYGLEDTIERLEPLRKVTYLNYQGVIAGNDSEGDDVRIPREMLGDHVHIVGDDKDYGLLRGKSLG